MKKILISPNESVQNGYRVADVSDIGFPVAEPLFWVDFDETQFEIQIDSHWYDPIDETFKPVPILEPEPAENQPTQSGAQEF